ncbi:Alpha/beta hydrolase fold-3 [Penicillium angulare]|uniref:Alpha/beta hydrolase fold-3 n=1 Tax=Penicillium angulare TaxID=116970 RepID=A0A9W9FX63_9EURO|nr:Alpha/beta hydrolase fold-3 [Penicillium angulare]
MTRRFSDDNALPKGWQTRRPGSLIYAFAFLLRVIPITIFYSLYYIPASFRQLKTWTYRQALLTRLIKEFCGLVTATGSTTPLSLEAENLGTQWVIMSPAPDSSYRGPLASDTAKPERIGATWYPHPSSENTAVDEKGLVVLSFHSGSFLWMTGRPEDSGAIAKKINAKFGPGTRSLWVQYRLAGGRTPTIYPGPMQDAITAYHYLVKEQNISPTQIIITGDSSGATIAVALLRYLASEDIRETEFAGLPAPKACLIFSPSVDYSFEGDGQEFQSHRNQKTDYCTGAMAAWGARAVAPPNVVPLDDPYLSPALHPFATSVPIFVQAGGAEVLCDVAKSFVTSMSSIDGNKIEWLKSPDLPHDIYAIGPLLGWPKEQEEIMDTAVKSVL